MKDYRYGFVLQLEEAEGGPRIVAIQELCGTGPKITLGQEAFVARRGATQLAASMKGRVVGIRRPWTDGVRNDVIAFRYDDSGETVGLPITELKLAA